MMRVLVCSALIVATGCAGVARRARSEVDRTRLAYARELGVERRAPLPYEKFEQARDAADASPSESSARQDYEAEERLWLETAITDAERERMAEQRLAEERKLLELDGQNLQLERERQRWAQQAELYAARALAQSEAQKALARAAERPSLRVKMPREDVKLAAESLLARCATLALTLESVAPDSKQLPVLRTRLSEAETLLAKDPEAALTRADQAYFFALSSFSALRSVDGEPSADERAALAEELASAGTRAVRAEQGLSGTLDHAFADAAVHAPTERVIERLCALAKAHPRGPLLLRAQGKNAAQSEAHLHALRERFTRAGCSGARFSYAADKREGDALEATWLSY